jgi:hypothetical protein
VHLACWAVERQQDLRRQHDPLQEACDEACSTAITVAARKALEHQCKDNQAQLPKLRHELALHIFGQPYEKVWSAMWQVRRHGH